MSGQTSYRLPDPGDLVTRTGGTLYRVQNVSAPDHRGDAGRVVSMTSERSGRRYTDLLGRLSWPRGEDGRTAPIIPWELRPARRPQPQPQHPERPAEQPKPRLRLVTTDLLPAGISACSINGDGEVVMLVSATHSAADIVRGLNQVLPQVLNESWLYIGQIGGDA